MIKVEDVEEIRRAYFREGVSIREDWPDAASQPARDSPGHRECRSW